MPSLVLVDAVERVNFWRSEEDLKGPRGSVEKRRSGKKIFLQLSKGKDLFTEDLAGPGGKTELVNWEELSHHPAAQPFGKLVSNLLQRVCQWDWDCCLVRRGSSQL